jgi:flavodoxin short chain
MAKTLLIYGSLTGNTENISHKIQALCQEKGKEIEVKNVMDAKVEDLTGSYECLVLASSTWDDGQPQTDFNDFIEKVVQVKPNLATKQIAIVGCGDSNYIHFCEATKVIEKIFVNDLGGHKIIETLCIDGYPETESNQTLLKRWVEKLVELID